MVVDRPGSAGEEVAAAFGGGYLEMGVSVPSKSVDNPMLNGQCLRLDAGQRFAPR